MPRKLKLHAKKMSRGSKIHQSEFRTKYYAPSTLRSLGKGKYEPKQTPSVQVPIEDGPLVCPEIDHVTMTRDEYQLQLKASRKLRKYVFGAHYEKLITSDEWEILDSRETGILQLNIKCGKNQEETTKLILIDSSDQHELKEALNQVANNLKPKDLNCRIDSGDDGGMAAVGRRGGGHKGPILQELMAIVNPKSKLYNKEVAQHLPKACRLMRQYIRRHVPWLLKEYAIVEEKNKAQIPKVMGGKFGVSASADVSINLCNATHIDINDGATSISMWTEKNPGEASNWYLLLPDTYCTRKKNKKPIAIQLFSGAVVVWDGRILRHASSKPIGVTDECSNDGNRVYGSFFCPTQK